MESTIWSTGDSMLVIMDTLGRRAFVPMFKATGYSIAINADEYTEAAATVKLKTDNIADILDLIIIDKE